MGSLHRGRGDCIAPEGGEGGLCVLLQGWSLSKGVFVQDLCQGDLCPGSLSWGSVKGVSVKGDRDSPAATEAGDTYPTGYTKLAMLTFLRIMRINWH